MHSFWATLYKAESYSVYSAVGTLCPSFIRVMSNSTTDMNRNLMACITQTSDYSLWNRALPWANKKKIQIKCLPLPPDPRCLSADDGNSHSPSLQGWSGDGTGIPGTSLLSQHGRSGEAEKGPYPSFAPGVWRRKPTRLSHGGRQTE